MNTMVVHFQKSAVPDARWVKLVRQLRGKYGKRTCTGAASVLVQGRGFSACILKAGVVELVSLPATRWPIGFSKRILNLCKKHLGLPKELFCALSTHQAKVQELQELLTSAKAIADASGLGTARIYSPKGEEVIIAAEKGIPACAG